MRAVLDLGRFTEVQCDTCGDTVYVKKFSALMPVMLDD